MAVQILNDSWHDRYDCAILVSNDSDLAEPLRLIKAEHQKNIGVIFPNTNLSQAPSKQLLQFADFVKPIRKHVLQNSQLPIKIPNSKISCPKAWNHTN